MKIQLASFKEISEGKALVKFDVLDEHNNFLAEFDLSYEVEYNADPEQTNTYQLYKYYFANTREKIDIENIDWGYIDSDQYKALSAFDRKYDIE